MAHPATTSTVAGRVLARLRTRLPGAAGVGIALVWELSR